MTTLQLQNIQCHQKKDFSRFSIKLFFYLDFFLFLMRNLIFTKVNGFTVLKTKGRKANNCQRHFRTPGWFWLFTQQHINSINTPRESVDSQLTILTPCK